MENEKEISQWKNRLCDLAMKSYQQNIFTFTGFLGLAEQDVFWRLQMAGGLGDIGFTLFGGRDGAERVMARFGDVEELGYEVSFPIVCIHMEALARKFADTLSHRDFLGALMNLGIERSVLGDIMVGDGEAFLFCQDNMAQFICENLTKVKHTQIRCKVTENWAEIPEEVPEVKSIQVASARVDAVIAKVYGKSRSECLELFREGKVFVNGRLCEQNARLLKQGDVVNARGYGKFILTRDCGETRKGKLSLQADIYR